MQICFVLVEEINSALGGIHNFCHFDRGSGQLILKSDKSGWKFEKSNFYETCG